MTKKKTEPTTDKPLPSSLAEYMGKKIRQARDDSGRTQADLAKEVSRRQASISEIENGKMTVDADTLARLAITLKKPISYFYPHWLIKMVQPEKLTPGEAELLSLAKKLRKEELETFIIQIRAVTERDERSYHQWLDESIEDQDNQTDI